jgi:hypothetical protein
MKNKPTLKMPPHVEAGLISQRQKFKAKFGREPGPNDPVFFDPACDTPTAITPEQFLNKALAATRSAGIDEQRARQFFSSIPNLTNANRFPNGDGNED